jgi:aspartyl-tRNA(Asn)/glutamyl-tRNA(Gln) amidotransferase subunit B
MKELNEVLQDWEAVIGLEVHAELTTLKTKMFCSCPIEFGAPPNTHTCPVCLGMPGALPVPNKAAIESIVLAGLATNCTIEKHTMFYRKGYFYPDMAKNFQTTQGPVAFCMRGHLDLEVAGKGAAERVDIAKDDDGGYVASIGITRIHMEEDAGKMTHFGGSEGRIDGAQRSLVDYNRAGTPLIELVTEPDLRTPEEARMFMQKLRQIYLALGISDCSMEEGSLRADGNVSLRRRGSKELGTKTELKNINSFKNLHDGLVYEIRRQAEVLESGGVIHQETRHWEPGAKRTIVMRVKETADDYRMFPDPDLAPFDLTDEFIENVKSKLPELPDAKKARLVEQFGLSKYDAGEIAGDIDASMLFEQSAESADKATVKKIANLIINDLSAWANEENASIAQASIDPKSLAKLAKLLADDTISSRQGKEILASMIKDDVDPEQYAQEHDMLQTTDTDAIDGIVDEIMAANADKVEAYRAGKKGLQGFFMGQTMKALQGQGNPKVISEIVSRKLEG